MKRLILGLLAIPAALLIFIYVKAAAQGLDGMRWAGGVMACAIPAFLLAGACVLIIIHSPADMFSRKDETK